MSVISNPLLPMPRRVDRVLFRTQPQEIGAGADPAATEGSTKTERNLYGGHGGRPAVVADRGLLSVLTGRMDGRTDGGRPLTSCPCPWARRAAGLFIGGGRRKEPRR